jgi:hypothetical protein
MIPYTAFCRKESQKSTTNSRVVVVLQQVQVSFRRTHLEALVHPQMTAAMLSGTSWNPLAEVSGGDLLPNPLLTVLLVVWKGVEGFVR